MGIRVPIMPAMIRFRVTTLGTEAIFRLNASIATAEFPKRSVALKDIVALFCSGAEKYICHVPFVSLYANGEVNTKPVELLYEPVTFPNPFVNEVPFGYFTRTGRSTLLRGGTVVELFARTRKLKRAGITSVVYVLFPAFPYGSFAAQVTL